MTGSMNDLSWVAVKSNGLAIDQALIRKRNFRCRNADPGCLVVHHLEQGKIVLIQEDGGTREAFELQGPSDMIYVGVRDENLAEFEAEFRESSVDAADLVSGIDHDRLAGSFIAKKSAVALQRSDRERLEDHAPILKGDVSLDHRETIARGACQERGDGEAWVELQEPTCRISPGLTLAWCRRARSGYGSPRERREPSE